MNPSSQHRAHRPLIAVDIGNSRTKLGLFVPPGAAPLPRPERMFSWGPPWRIAETEEWLAAPPDAFDWRIGSVNRVGTGRLLDWLTRRGASRVQVLSAADIPLPARVDEPDKVGLDRLANALAADRLRSGDRGAIVVDLGSAITVDVVSRDGAFLGGAILPGIAMSARALHEFTDLLPLEPMSELAQPPAALGKTTSACLQSGLYWGAIGGVRELIARLAVDSEKPQLFVTGGAGAAAAGLLTGPDEPAALLVPHLTLAGIALAGPPD
ncbi:MAG TPA: type III pantothenate kinase [Pirellulales bacterium]|jgi:type III pantothenate kinase|nr:type III pantothenate kinase [Pirellulales bacterium]